jgi:hypothetical protein
MVRSQRKKQKAQVERVQAARAQAASDCWICADGLVVWTKDAPRPYRKGEDDRAAALPCPDCQGGILTVRLRLAHTAAGKSPASPSSAQQTSKRRRAA